MWMEDVPRSLLDQIKPGYEVRRLRGDGKLEVFTGRDLEAFLARDDNRFHSHSVWDTHGNMVYSRDKWGKITVGTPVQLRKQEQQNKVGAAATSSALGDAVKTSRRWWRLMSGG